MQERHENPKSASDWLPSADLGEPDESQTSTPAAAGPPETGERHKGSRFGAARAIGLGAVVAIVLLGVLLASGALNPAPNGASSPSLESEPLLLGGDESSDRRLIHRGLAPLGVVRVGDLSPSAAYLLAAAAQVRDERIDARKPQPDTIGPEGSLSLYPIDSDDRYGYLVRVAALGKLFADFERRTARVRDRGSLTPRAATTLRTALGRIESLVSGLDGSLYKRSKRLHAIITQGTQDVEDVVDAERTDRLRTLGTHLGELGLAIRVRLRRAADAASARDQEGASRLLAATDRKLTLINDPA